MDKRAQPTAQPKPTGNATNSPDDKLVQQSFWGAFVEYMKENPSKIFHTQSPQPRAWMTVRMGSSSHKLSLALNSMEKTVTVRLEMGDDFDKRYFDALLKHKDEVEAAIGTPLVWSRLDGKKMSHVGLTRQGDFMDDRTWQELIEWFRNTTELFITTFKPLVR